ncbi:hypothetical protein NMG46_10055 [Mesorhizobium sp. LMG 17147]|uniref:hypothetical protein n=1 Tax=Mesorhizobium sp. LMG 17147 TaxID=2963091 RepID=UPI0020C94271|nr:hypothetical protein [Mesorhizobium sp. LMG 17147]MCP9230587.1 hypothetical protein [Mesorhizobium sp. LMG 17147]
MEQKVFGRENTLARHTVLGDAADRSAGKVHHAAGTTWQKVPCHRNSIELCIGSLISDIPGNRCKRAHLFFFKRRYEPVPKLAITVTVHYVLFAACPRVSGFYGFADLPGDAPPTGASITATSATRQYSMSSSCGTHSLRT